MISMWLSACAQMDFKNQWRVLVGMLGDGSGAADMFCRILVALDEDIISLDIPRSQDGVRASMELKVGPHHKRPYLQTFLCPRLLTPVCEALTC